MRRHREIVLCAAVAAAVLCACSPCGRLSHRCPPIEYVRDSIEIHDTLIRETLITDTLVDVRLVRETVYVQTPVTDTARGETSYAYGLAWVDGTRVMLALTNKDSAEVLTQRIKVLERQLHAERQRTEKVAVKTEYRTRGIVKAGSWIGLAAVVYLAARIIVFILRRL